MSHLNSKVPFVEIHLTQQCNLRCYWCTYAHQPRTEHITLGDLECLRELQPE